MDVALGSHLAKGRRGVKHGCFGADFFLQTDRVVGTDLT